MKSSLFFFTILFSIYVSAQEVKIGYQLVPGKKYSLNIAVQQNTFSETYDPGNEVSLDLKMTIHFNVQSHMNHDLYYIDVNYDGLFLSMLAPTLGIDINSESGKNAIIPVLIDTLQSKTFKIQLNRDGSILILRDINEFFYDMYDYTISTMEEQDIIIKTLKEAFGNNAFQSICNIFVNIYPSIQSAREWEKEFKYYFNTKPVNMSNIFFLIKQTEKQNTIQGMGMISTMDEVIETRNGTTVQSSASGSQTFDLQLDPESGWMIQGSSRQRILIQTTILSDPRLPTGLKIPSYTETTFKITGEIDN